MLQDGEPWEYALWGEGLVSGAYARARGSVAHPAAKADFLVLLLQAFSTTHWLVDTLEGECPESSMPFAVRSTKLRLVRTGLEEPGSVETYLAAQRRCGTPITWWPDHHSRS